MRKLKIKMPFPVPDQERYVPYDMMLNDMGFWFPILRRSGVNVPKTIIISDWQKTDVTASKILEAMDIIGYPCFFRGCNIAASLKQKWDKTCFVYSRPAISEIMHRMGLVLSHCVSGNEGAEPLIYDNWAVRKYINCDTVHSYLDMPLKRELRVFINHNYPTCMHHYWEKQIPEGVVNFTDYELEKVHTEACKVAKYFYGFWSCDFMLGQDGNWYAIDMALGEDSFHLENCKKIKIVDGSVTYLPENELVSRSN